MWSAQEMEWLANDIREERKWKIALAKNISKAVLKYWHTDGNLARKTRNEQKGAGYGGESQSGSLRQAELERYPTMYCVINGKAYVAGPAKQPVVTLSQRDGTTIVTNCARITRGVRAGAAKTGAASGRGVQARAYSTSEARSEPTAVVQHPAPPGSRLRLPWKPWKLAAAVPPAHDSALERNVPAQLELRGGVRARPRLRLNMADWTEEQLLSLVRVVQLFGQNWMLVSDAVSQPWSTQPWRSPEQCHATHLQCVTLLAFRPAPPLSRNGQRSSLPWLRIQEAVPFRSGPFVVPPNAAPHVVVRGRKGGRTTRCELRSVVHSTLSSSQIRIGGDRERWCGGSW